MGLMDSTEEISRGSRIIKFNSLHFFWVLLVTFLSIISLLLLVLLLESIIPAVPIHNPWHPVRSPFYRALSISDEQ